MAASDVVQFALETLNGGARRQSALAYDYLVKLILIGDSGVGKSSMLLRFVEGPQGGPHRGSRNSRGPSKIHRGPHNSHHGGPHSHEKRPSEGPQGPSIQDPAEVSPQVSALQHPSQGPLKGPPKEDPSVGPPIQYPTEVSPQVSALRHPSQGSLQGPPNEDPSLGLPQGPDDLPQLGMDSQGAPEGGPLYPLPATLSIDYMSKMMAIGEEIAKVQIWDTAGHERYRSVTQAYFRSAMGVMLVFDLSCKESFRSIDYWVSAMKEEAPPHVQVLLVGNKSDLKNRAVGRGEAEALAVRLGVSYMETSALSGYCLDKAFRSLTAKVLLFIKHLETLLAAAPPNSSNSSSSSSSSISSININSNSSSSNRKRESLPISAALQQGAFDLVQGLSLVGSDDGGTPYLGAHPSMGGPPMSGGPPLGRHMEFKRYPLDDAIDKLCGA